MEVVGDKPQETYVFSVEAVGRAVKLLASTPAHEHFAGYLALLKAERRDKGGLHRSETIWDFHRRYLTVAGLEENTPFYSPVRPPEGGIPKLIYKNLAGSYGPASLKPGNPFLDAVEVEGRGQAATYALKPKHQQAILDGMLKGKRMQAIGLAAYLFRDFGLELGRRSLQDVLDIFRDEFGLRAHHPEEAATFGVLFTPSLDGFSDNDLVPFEEGGI